MYYATSDDQHHNCTGECHTLSYYTNKTDWSPNTTLIFLPGEHKLTSHFIIEKLHNIILKGLGNDLPVINCTSNSLTINVSDCYAVGMENLKIECTFLSLTNIIRTNIAKIIARGLFYSQTFLIIPKVIISSSEFLCQHKALAKPCIIIFVDTGDLLLQDTVISSNNGIGAHIESKRNFYKLFLNSVLVTIKKNTLLSHGKNYGIYIMNREFSYISLYNITVSNEQGSGMYIESYAGIITLNSISSNGNVGDGIFLNFSQLRKISVSHVNVSNNGQYGLCLLLYYYSAANLTDIFANDCSNGLFLNFKLVDNHVVISLVTATRNKYQGILLQNDASNNTVHVVNSTFRDNYFGVLIFSNQILSTFYLTGVLVTNSSRAGIIAECNSQNCTLKLNNVTVTDNPSTGIVTNGPWAMYFQNYSSTISNNRSPMNGGGMWISQRTLISGDVEVYFINNTAQRFGGAIYADEIHYTVFIYFSSTIKYYIPVFENNSALVAGDNVYNGLYFEYTNETDYFAKKIKCSNISYLSHFPRPLSMYITSTPLGVCMCDKDLSVNCRNRSFDIVLYPGQSITLPLVTVGACGGMSPSILVTSNTSGVEVLHADYSNQETIRQCKNFTYIINQQNSFKTNGKILIGIKENINLKGSKLMLNTTFQQCPHGLHVMSGSCQCDHIIGAVNGTQCDINMMPHPISRSGNNWLYYSEDYHCIIAHGNCPFDYCKTSTIYLNLNESDLQCTNGRSGILCGECQPGLSLTLGSNKCEQCSNKYISLVVAFFLAGLALVIFLLVSNLTVSVGSINGLLFYANVIKLNEAVLFPNGVSIPVLSQFIAWLNLDLGIETCFFNGLDGYWKAWLQFAFPLYIWLLIGGVIIGCYYSGRLARLCGNNAVPVLATLIFMSYAKLLRVITNILMLAVIRCKDTHWLVWSVDGNIGYLSSKHIPLFVIAMVFVFLGLVYTVLVFSAQWLQRYSGKCFKSSRDPVVKLKPFIDAYTGPYKDKYRYWTGLLLIVRLLLTTVFSYTTGIVPQINNYIIAVITAVLLYLSRGVYRDRKLDMLEAFYLVNLFVMALLNTLSYITILHLTSTTVTAVSISLSLAAFVCMTAIRILTQIKAKYGLHFCTNKKLKIKGEKEEPLLNEEMLHSPSHIVMRRDSMIFDLQYHELNIVLSL